MYLKNIFIFKMYFEKYTKKMAKRYIGSIIYKYSYILAFFVLILKHIWE